MLLKKGSKGDNVKLLQVKLGLNSDGDFGPGTEAKVKEWQTKNGLTPDGVVGYPTWNKLFNVSSKFNLVALKGHVPDSVISQIDVVADKFNITTPLRLSHFLAQCSHESGGFKAIQENVNYSADGLKKIFGKYFPGNMADLYARKPEKIASRVYASRMGNGDESTREGFIFRGRGYIQLTGKSNYTSFSKFIGEDCVVNPDLVATKYPLASAAFFFDSNKIWSICDKGSNLETITAVTKRINGGTIGLTDRVNEFNKIYAILKE
jgi:putative chitinase